MKGSKFMYLDGYVKGAYIRKPRAPVPAHDIIKLEIRRKTGREIIVYMRPDEAVATAAVLMAAVWDSQVNQ